MVGCDRKIAEYFCSRNFLKCTLALIEISKLNRSPSLLVLPTLGFPWLNHVKVFLCAWFSGYFIFAVHPELGTQCIWCHKIQEVNFYFCFEYNFIGLKI